MPSAVYNLIRQAILDKQNIRATYHGHVRDMSPHMLGTKGAKEQGLFFQFAGDSQRGLPPGGEWWCLTLDDLSRASVIEGEWRTRPDYSPRNELCVDQIDVLVPR
jgi:hypothetical protein